MAEDRHHPEHWHKSTWEEKARENPLHAIMTVEAYRDKTLDDLDHGAPEEFFAKGRVVYSRMVDAYLTPNEKSRRLSMFDYGCGAGRIMNAVVEAGHDAKGADIAPTMVETCKRLVPKASECVVVGEDGSVALPDRSCDVVYSYAVLQHISTLKAFERALDEMMRIVKPGGLLSVQVNCEDFALGDKRSPGHTENYENSSVHFADPEKGPARAHAQDNWSGVYIGVDRYIRQVNSGGFHIADFFYWNPGKRRAMIFIARRSAGKNAFEPRPDPFRKITANMYRALLKAYVRETLDRKRLKKKVQELMEAAGEAGEKI